LKWEYRFLVNAIDDIPGITELVISQGTETTVAPPAYRLGVKRFEQLRRAIDSIARRYQREALEDKLLLAVSQVLDQKYRLQTSFTQKAYESGLVNVHPYSIQCIVIVGTSPLQRDERKSFELLRNSTKDVTIVTFDELLEKLKEIQRVFSAADDNASKAPDTNVPF
jgi:hypothetical protein